MTISSQTFRFEYASTGATVYPYTNKILADDDLAVYVDDVLQSVGTNYSVDGVGVDTGGNVTFVAAPAAGTTVLITKDGVQITQETDYRENDSFPASAHEDALDKLTNIAQKIWDYTRRSIKVAITSSLSDLELTPVASGYLCWNAAGTAIEAVTAISGTGSISDAPYNSTTWDGATGVAPSKNAVRDRLESIIAETAVSVASVVSDTAYSSTVWGAVTTVAPSKGAMATELESIRSDMGAAIGLYNLGIAASVATSALTIALKGADLNDPSPTNIVGITFRDDSSTVGANNYRTVSSAKSITLPATATLNFAADETGRIYFGAIDSDGAGTIAPCIARSATPFNEGGLATSVAVTVTSDNATELYSDAVYTDKPARVLGYVDLKCGSTAGHWTNDPLKVQPMGYGVKRTGEIEQVVYYSNSTYATGATNFPSDNTIPQNTEGDQYMALSMTPRNAANKLMVDVNFFGAASGAAVILHLALFRDTTASALAAISDKNAADYTCVIPLRHYVTAGAAVSTTFHVRVGNAGGATVYFNGDSSGQYYGGVAASNITVTEITA